MILLKNVSFEYTKKQPLFQNLNLSMASGRIYGLFGENGAGKSTLVKNLSGLLFPRSGEILVNDNIPKDRCPLFLSDTFLIPEDFHFPNMKIERYLKLYSGFYPNFSIAQFNEHTEAFDIPNTKNIGHLSFGQQKKLIVSFALATNTRVLLMDEPTNGLDIPSKSIFRKLLAASISPEKTYIISTHQVRDLESIIDQVLIINNGEIVLNANIDEITEKLSFKLFPQNKILGECLYREDTLRGIAAVIKNTSEEYTKINIELLYGATINNKKKIKELFQ